jgi:hypothetical protein
MNVQAFRSGLLVLAVFVALSVLARLTFLDGSLFDPEVAPGVAFVALGDLLAVAAFLGGYLRALTRRAL